MPSSTRTRATKAKPFSPRRRGRDYIQLDRDTLAAFLPYINVNDPGRWADYHDPATGEHVTGPQHTLSDDFWRAYEAGEEGTSRYYHANVYSLRHVYDQRTDKTKSYYTSGRHLHGLLYLDIDAHHGFQRADIRRAASLLEALFGRVFLSWPGDRGHNGYLKVAHLGDWERFNAAAARLEAGLRRLLDRERVLCDIEVKGTITTKTKRNGRAGTSGSLGKLPFRQLPRWDCLTHGKRSWDRQALEEFKGLPDLGLEDIECVCDLLDAIAPDTDDRAHAGLRQLFKDAVDAEKLAKNLRRTRATSPTTSPVRQPAEPSAVPNGQAAPRMRRAARLDAGLLTQLAAEPDRFRAAASFCRAYARKLRRVPTIDECLDAMYELGVYTGSWEDNEAGRRARVAYILEHYVGPSFDASRCGGGADLDPLRLLAERYVRWASKKFGTASVGTDEKGRVRPVESNDIGVLAAIAEFCLKVDQGPKADGGMPWERVAALWGTLHAAGIAEHAACSVRWRRVREFLDRHGIVVVIDRKKRSGKSFRYALGEWFPGAWRKRQDQEECRTRPSLRSGTSTGGVAASLRSADATPLVQGVRVGTGALLTHTRHTHIPNLCVEDLSLPAVRIAPRAPP